MLCTPVEPATIDRYVCDDEWLAQQKLDGHRVLARVDDGAVTAFGRDGQRRSAALPGEVERQLARLSPGEWWLDGELLGDVLWLFDLPAAFGTVSFVDPFEQRYRTLQLFASGFWRPGPAVQLVPVARAIDDKLALVREVLGSGGEGVVFRHRDSCYAPGKRAERVVKAKFTTTVDVVVTALGVEGKDNCAFEVYDDAGAAVDVGRCPLLGKPPVAVGDVIEVKYLYAVDRAEPRLVQARMLRVRDDKPARECSLSQLKFTDKAARAEWLR